MLNIWSEVNEKLYTPLSWMLSCKFRVWTVKITQIYLDESCQAMKVYCYEAIQSYFYFFVPFHSSYDVSKCLQGWKNKHCGPSLKLDHQLGRLHVGQFHFHWTNVTSSGFECSGNHSNSMRRFSTRPVWYSDSLWRCHLSLSLRTRQRQEQTQRWFMEDVRKSFGSEAGDTTSAGSWHNGWNKAWKQKRNIVFGQLGTTCRLYEFAGDLSTSEEQSSFSFASGQPPPSISMSLRLNQPFSSVLLLSGLKIFPGTSEKGSINHLLTSPKSHWGPVRFIVTNRRVFYFLPTGETLTVC